MAHSATGAVTRARVLRSCARRARRHRVRHSPFRSLLPLARVCGRGARWRWWRRRRRRQRELMTRAVMRTRNRCHCAQRTRRHLACRPSFRSPLRADGAPADGAEPAARVGRAANDRADGARAAEGRADGARAAEGRADGAHRARGRRQGRRPSRRHARGVRPWPSRRRARGTRPTARGIHGGRQSRRGARGVRPWLSPRRLRGARLWLSRRRARGVWLWLNRRTAREGHAVDGARRARRTSEPTGRAGRAAVAEPTGRTGRGDHARWIGWFLPPLPRRAWRVMSLSLSFRRSTFRSAPAPHSTARRCALPRVTSQKRRTRQCHMLRDHARARDTNRRHTCDGDDHDPPVTATPTTTATIASASATPPPAARHK